jgi:hypothetical protein
MQMVSGVELQAMIGARDRRIEPAIDCVENPMTDKRLETMFADLMDGIIPTHAIRRGMDACRNAGRLPSAVGIA